MHKVQSIPITLPVLWEEEIRVLHIYTHLDTLAILLTSF